MDARYYLGIAYMQVEEYLDAKDSFNKAINIDKDNFNEVLKGQNLNLQTTVENKLSDEPDAQMSVNLDFKSLKDFDKLPFLTSTYIAEWQESVRKAFEA